MDIAHPYSFAKMKAYLGAQEQRAESSQQVASPAKQLVAGRVEGKVYFEQVPLADVQPLQLYARNADRIEAATRIAKGQSLNIIV